MYDDTEFNDVWDPIDSPEVDEDDSYDDIPYSEFIYSDVDRYF